MTFGIPWERWEPIYGEIIRDFGFDRSADIQARDELHARCSDRCLNAPDLPIGRGRSIAIAGGASTLLEDVDRANAADLIFAASIATETLRDVGVEVDLHITDLDKDELTTVQRSQEGKPVCLHAHGDNRSQLTQYMPAMDTQFVFPTTQVAPTPVVQNPGGFTDGDRAAFLAHALGADELVFLGWDFDDPTVRAEKRKKLHWAAILLHWLEQERGEQFPVLDGRRNGLSKSWRRDD